MFDDLIPGAKPAAPDSGTFSDLVPKPAEPGFVSTVKRTGGQMLSSGATALEDVTGPNVVTRGVRDLGQGIIDRNPAGITSLGDIVDKPVLAVKEAVGQFVPQIGAAAAGAAAGAKIGGRFGGAPGAAVGATVGGLAPIFAQEYGGIRQEQIEGGQEDKGRALAAATGATALERVGMGRILKGIQKPGSIDVASIPREIAAGAAREGLTEAAQTGIEQVGAFKDPLAPESRAEQLLAGAMGGIGGGVVSGVNAGVQRALKPAPAEEPAPAPGGEPLRGQKLPVTGPLTAAVNAGIEAEAAAADGGAPVVAPISGALAGVTPPPAPETQGPDGETKPPGGETIPAGDATETAPDDEGAPVFDPASATIAPTPRATFNSREEVEQHLSRQRRSGGAKQGKALPYKGWDGGWTFVREGEPDFEQAQKDEAQIEADERMRADQAFDKALPTMPQHLRDLKPADRKTFGLDKAVEQAGKALATNEPIGEEPGRTGVAFTPEIAVMQAHNAKQATKTQDGMLRSGNRTGATTAGLVESWVRQRQGEALIERSRKEQPDLWRAYDERQKAMADVKVGDTVLTPYPSLANPLGSPGRLVRKFSTNWRIELDDGSAVMVPPTALRPVKETAPAVEQEPTAAAPVKEAAQSAPAAPTPQPSAEAPIAAPAPAQAPAPAVPSAKEIDAAAAEAATSPANDRPEPTDAQKEAGNYKKGHVVIDGMGVTIENDKGSIRRSKDGDPKPWEVVMPVHYGYIKGTVGADTVDPKKPEQVDIALGPKGANGRYWVINQTTPDGKTFDEHKVFTGVDSADEAVALYKASFADGFGEKVYQSISAEYDADAFKALLPSLKKARAVKPAASNAVEKPEAAAPAPAPPAPRWEGFQVVPAPGRQGRFLVGEPRGDGTMQNLAEFGLNSTTGRPVGIQHFFDSQSTREPVEKAIRGWADQRIREQAERSNPMRAPAPSAAGPRVIINRLGPDGLTDTERAAGKKPYTDEAPAAPAPKPPADKKDTIVGRRADGVMIRQDEFGVRFYSANGVRVSETVALRPTREGMKISRGELKPEFMTAEESAARAPAPAPQAADQWVYRDTATKTMKPLPASSEPREVLQDAVPGLRFVVHKSIDEAGYTVTEGSSGMSLAKGTTPEMAEFAAQQRIDRHGADTVRQKVSDALAATTAAADTQSEAPDAPAPATAAAPALDRPGERALEGTPAAPVRGADGGGDAAAGAARGGRSDLAGTAGAAGPGAGRDDGLGDGARAAPVSARGAGRQPAATGEPGVSGAPRPDARAGSGEDAGRAGRLSQAPNAAPPVPPQFTPAGPQALVPQAPELDLPPVTDFRIEDDLALGEGGQKAKFRGNVEAIKTLRAIEAAGRLATPDEQRILARYVGWGQLSQAFDESNRDWTREHAELKALLSPEEYEAAKESTQYAHYTSREIIAGIYAALQHMGFTGGRIVEPGAGVGNFIGLMPEALRTASRFTGIERELISSGIARQLYPQQNIQQADFTEFIGNDGYFDAAIGNPPFARTALTDQSGRKHLSGLSVHNYFFAKAVDMLREGGILAQVVSNSFLDAKRDVARRYIADRVEFLGAIRLPNNAFAKNAGTEVTTDLIFLKKLPEGQWASRDNKANRDQWLDIETVPDPNGGEAVPLNRYFVEHPEMMLGAMGRYGTMYGPGQPALVANPGQDTAALLREAVAKLPGGVYVPRVVAATEQSTERAIVALGDSTVQEGGHYVADGRLYQRLQDEAGEQRAVEITPETQWTEKTKLGPNGFARMKALAQMRTTLRSLLAAELANEDRAERLRASLNRQYDAYVKEHGLINDKPTARVFDDDPDYPLLASLEHGYTPGIGEAAARKLGVAPMKATARKGPIFAGRVVSARTTPTRADSPADALNISLAERGRIDAEFIGKLLGQDGAEALEAMAAGERPLLFLDPGTREYVLRDAYLSGNVRAKLAQARAAGMLANARALEAVQPADVPAHEISVRLGSPWVPTAVYEGFAKQLFGENTKASIYYTKANSAFTGSFKGVSEIAATNTWGTNDVSGPELLIASMNNRDIKVTYLDADKKLRTDVEKTEAANLKAGEIRQAFLDWAFKDADRSELLTKTYNETNNNYVTRAFDGGYMQFPGKVPDSAIKFRRHQRNAIARIVQDRTALLDHVVGAGKTFTIVSAAMEMKRTGLANKPMVVVPNHLVKQWAADFYRLYPGARVLTATKKDFQKINRRRFLAKIATGDWDAVVMAHSSFGFIRPAPEFEARFNEKQVRSIMETIKAVEEQDLDARDKKRTVKQLAALKERLENRIKALRDKPIDALLDFQQLGVDQLFVDEAHLFKNLMFTTKMQNVRGLGDSAGSQRAYDLFVKAHQLFEQNGRGQGLVFATGTPVSNSLAEMYHMMRYLMPAQMEAAGFASFDAWANTFASVEQTWMQKFSGDGFKADNRMSTFVNTPELLKMFDQVADTVTMDDIKAAFREENDGREFPLPKLKTGRRQPVSLVKSAAQNAYMAEIAARAKAIEGKRTNQKGMDNALTIMGDARKAAMDIRLVDPDVVAREPGGRIDSAAMQIIARYRQYDRVKGTQLVFSDLGTPIKHAKKEMKEWEALQERIQKGADPETQVSANLGNEAAMAVIDDAEAAQAELDAMGPDWLDAVKAALRGFSVYDDLKAALVEQGIPESEIAFIHDYNTDDQKASLFRQVNAGTIRVLMGSTPKLGAGTNVQERLVALHHLDVPWKPSDVEQREGRIIRQGNVLAEQLPDFEVEILGYVTRDTLDMRMWQIQETKLKMINQLRSRKIGREIDNAFEDMEMSAGEMQAAATGNIDLLKEIQLRSDVRKLEQQQRSFDAQRNDLETRRKRAAEALRTLPAKVEQAKKLAVASDAYRAAQDARRAAFRATIDGQEYTDAKEAGRALQAIVDTKVYIEHGSKRQISQDEYRALPQDEREATVEDNGKSVSKWSSRAAPIDVEFNGQRYTGREKLSEAYAAVRGDANPPMWAYQGTTHDRATSLEGALLSAVSSAVLDEKLVQLGKLGDFEVSVEGQGKDRIGDNHSVEIVVSYGGQSLDTVNAIAPDAEGLRRGTRNLIGAAMSLVSGASSRAAWLEDDLRRAQATADELAKTEAMGEWPGAAKLAAKRAEHRDVLKRLSSAAVKQTADGVNIAQTGAPEANETDVVFNRRDEPAPPFYSELARQIERTVMRSADAANWLNVLRGLPQKGVKPDEIEWSGLPDWLRLQQGKVTKQAVVDYLDGNGVRVTETVLGGRDALRELNDLVVQADALGFVFDRNRFEDGDEYIGREVLFRRRLDGAVFEFTDDRMALVESAPEEDYAGDPPERLREIAMKIDQLGADEREGLDADGTKYSNYTLPGGENYREVLLTLPTGAKMQGALERAADGEMMIRWADGTGEYLGTKNRADAQRMLDAKTPDTAYKSGHWDQPNILAHIRVNDRTDAEGRKTLFVEEIQGDWPQAMRKQRDAIAKAVDSDFNGIVERMKKAGVLEVACD